jgi:hypothetical protein
MTDIHIIVPVANPDIQDFSNLVSELCGNYVPQDHVITTRDENGEEVEEVVENPYKDVPAPDYSNKITLVSHTAVDAPEGADNIVVEGELNVAKLWNEGVAHAVANDATHVVVLNEVSSISPYVFADAVDESTADVINLSDGGCFVVAPDVEANETYRWWFADVDLFETNNTDVVRKEFIDIVQENRIPIEGEMQAIVDADMANYGV